MFTQVVSAFKSPLSVKFPSVSYRRLRCIQTDPMTRSIQPDGQTYTISMLLKVEDATKFSKFSEFIEFNMTLIKINSRAVWP